MTAVDFPTSLFTDPSRAQRNLHTIHEMFIGSGAQFPVREFSAALFGHVHNSPDPDAAITNLLRFSEATLSKASLFNDLLKYPVTMEVLLKIFGCSQYLSDILVRDPELFRWLTASDVLMKQQTKEGLTSEVQRIERMFGRPEKRLDALRRLYRRELLRIGARDILGNADLSTVTLELSLLADALIDASCRMAEAALREKYGIVPDARYAVIGLGKLGGNELNYSSDIDIIFVYDTEGDLSTAKGVTHHEYFNKFVERLVQNLSQHSGEGHLYRVDTRLRPESGMGPLARSVQSYLLYYESRGELWERQMLIKARPVAGDLEFGGGFLNQLTPFIYPRTFFTQPTEAIARIKSRIEAAVAGDDNIKLQPGGIRDIEFIVQALQLLNGGKNSSIRSVNTLNSISLLGGHGLLSNDEQQTLREAYTFFRTIEHRLQTVLNRQTHTIPSSQQERTSLAKRAGVHSPDEFLSRIGAYRKGVKDIFDTVLKVEKDAVGSSGIDSIIEGGASEEAMFEVMAGLGFRDVRRSAKVLMSFVSAERLADVRVLDTRARVAFRQVAAEVVQRISMSPSPDFALLNFGLLVEAQRFPEQFFTQLKEESFRKLIFTVCDVSTRLTRSLAKDVLLLELLASDRSALATPWDGKRPRGMKLIALKHREEVRACIRYLSGVSSFDEFTVELSRIADVILSAVLKEECRKKNLSNPPLAVFALGKYGTRELSIDADLDVLFIADLGTKTASNKFEKVATAMMQKLTSVGEGGKLYDLDVRLRPEGRSAPLVVDRKAYAAYLRGRASLWERQSLTRLRYVCGNEKIAGAVQGNVETFVYNDPLPSGWTDLIVDMRRKMETRSHTQSSEFVDVKLGPGGMVDVEFIAQMTQMKFGGSNPALRHLPASGVLASGLSGTVPGDQAALIQSIYQLYRRVELMMRLALEERSTMLPQGEKVGFLAMMLGVSTGEGLHRQLTMNMKHIRSQFLHTANELSSN